MYQGDINVMDYIIKQALILIPVLYVLGSVLKRTEFPDKYIPVIIVILGIVLSLFLIGFNIQGIIQGILVAGATVLIDQTPKQLKKNE